MSRRPEPVDGPDEHPAGAGNSHVRVGGLPVSGDVASDRDDLADILAGGDPRLAAFLDRSAEVLRAGPDEVTTRRHLSMMRKEAPVVTPRGHGLRVVSIAAAAAIAAVVTLAGFGALPAPAQQVVSDVAERIGITLPSPADARPPSFEVPTQQRPDPETVPDRPGGPDRSELPGLGDDGVLQTPRESDGTPLDERPDETPGTEHGQPPERDHSEEVPADRRAPEQPSAPESPDGRSGSPPDDPADVPPGEPEDPRSAPEQAPAPPGETPAPPPDAPEHEDPPAAGPGADTSGEQTDTATQPGGR